MPLHEYITADGGIVEILQGTKWTEVPSSWKRVITCGSVATSGGVKEKSTSQQVKEGYYKAECKDGSRFKSTHSKSKIKAAWGW